MIYKVGDIISDGITGKRVSVGFDNWHSDMDMSEIDGISCEPIIIPKLQDIPSSFTSWPSNGHTNTIRKPNRRWCPTHKALG